MSGRSDALGPDRRVGSRRAHRAERALVAYARIDPNRHWFPASWAFVSACLALAIAVCAASASGLPDTPTLAMLAASPFPPLATRFALRFNPRRGFHVRVAALLGVVVLPLFLFGLGVSHWATKGGISWETALAALLCISGVAVATLRGRPAVTFAMILAVWSGCVIAKASLAGVGALGVGLSMAIFVGRILEREQRESEDQLRIELRVQSRARDILSDYEETHQGWFWETDRRSLLTYISRPIAQALGTTPEKLVGHPLIDLFDLEDTGHEGERTLMFHLSARSAFQELQVRAATAGEERWWSVSGRPIYDEFDNFVGFRGSGTDLTEKRRSQEHASRLAHYDSLTGLANRFHMAQALEKILTTPQDHDRACAVLLLDLDRFKHVNDTLGHPAGDALLKQVAGRLERVAGQHCQVGRLGGDEFEVILPGRIERGTLGQLGMRIIDALSQPYVIDGQRVVIGASVGIAVAPDDGITADALIRNADLALYAAKDAGRGRYHFYASDLHAEAEARSMLEQDLRDAISHGELQLFYQPVISTATETIVGFEALLRWKHPKRGWISPDVFISIAEDSGLIAQMGDWALRTACLDMARWPVPVRCAVNVSPLQFANPQFPAVVTQAIAQAGIEPSRLELEITESVFLNDDESTDAMFAALKRIGVRLALDDFGTGYSSLGYLRKAPFDKIKIDQSFVRGATQPGSRNGAIIASITSLAFALGMDSTAEGVETLDELELVRMHGCSHVQGFIYERPLSADGASNRLEAGLHAVARGPRSTRSPRQTMLRTVVLERDGDRCTATIRNISLHGALIEGLWNVPAGTQFEVHLSEDKRVTATTRWSDEDKMGVEFATPVVGPALGALVPATKAGGSRVTRPRKAEAVTAKAAPLALK